MSDAGQMGNDSSNENAKYVSLPKGWTWASVRQLVKSARYGSSAKTTGDESGVPVLRMGNIKEGQIDLTDLKYLPVDHHEFPSLHLKAGDLLFNRTNSAELVGKTAVYFGNPEVCSFASYLISLRMYPECDSRFLSHYINSVFGRKWISSVVSQQVGQANVNGSKLQSLTFPLPPEKEQVRIVSKIEELFSELDAGVASLVRLRGNLKRYRAAVLKAAVGGELTEHWRSKHANTEPASLLLDRILIEHRRKWEEVQLVKFAQAEKKPPKDWKTKYKEVSGSIHSAQENYPISWCWAKLGQVATFQNGHAFPSSQYQDEGVRLLRPGNLIEDGTVRWNQRNTRMLPYRWAEEHPDHMVRGGELIMNLTAQSPQG